MSHLAEADTYRTFEEDFMRSLSPLFAGERSALLHRSSPMMRVSLAIQKGVGCL